MTVAVTAALAPGDAAAPANARWRLHRAGIVNVYQCEDEVLRFGGGRLLLRGVNGSGKSTAMNMLLPFLLTARLGRIDAAGEQSGILRSWMLDGRDDAQPVGYLWIEFERAGEHLACGCGVRASRSSGTVTTWWFLTSRRPRIDLDLVERGVPLSADALRAALDGDEVFGHDRRRDYRAAVERRLFGGASLDQRIALINVVRSPRVGDRIDVDLPEHLVDALPRLSERTLAEAAQPLDDLEEHRRNVAELARTAQAIDALLEVYRAYGASELRTRLEEGRQRLVTLRARQPEETRRRRSLEDARSTLGRLDDECAAREQHERLAALLDRRQDDALRELLQGLIAREVAEKVHGAGRLIELMNRRLATARTSHDVGVRLRWRRSPELDASTARLVELLATLPEPRTTEDERELREALSRRLADERAVRPDITYRELIADTLDYTRWHEMSVMLGRIDGRETKLGRRTPLSEGEKKLVTYLPLFAAVAASCDSLAERATAPGAAPSGIARFVLLDDAFAKVSEDNHAALFGLLVELDLDLIATSERLWGTHPNVPELAIIEVVRDAEAGVILLEHYRWDGRTLERSGES